MTKKNPVFDKKSLPWNFHSTIGATAAAHLKTSPPSARALVAT